MPRLLDNLLSKKEEEIKERTQKYLSCFEYPKVHVFFSTLAGNSVEDKYLYLSIIAANHSWYGLTLQQMSICLSFLSNGEIILESFDSKVKSIINCLILGDNKLDSDLFKPLSYDVADFTKYIINLPSPLNLKCITDILNSDLSKTQDRWACFINATMSVKSSYALLNELTTSLAEINQIYYTQNSFSNIAPEFITALSKKEFKKHLTPIFSLLIHQLKLGNNKITVPQEIMTWQQQYFGLIQKNNPQKIVKQSLVAMPEGDKKDFHINRSMDPDYLIGSFLSHNHSLEYSSRAYLNFRMFYPVKIAPKNSKESYSESDGELKALGMIKL